MAFNAAYDFTVLANECARYGLQTPTATPVIDPFILDKQMDRYRRGKRTLVALCELYGVRLEAAHTSAADALATIGVADALARRYPGLCIDAAELHERQIGWCAQQAASFQEWLRRTESGSGRGRRLARSPDARGRLTLHRRPEMPAATLERFTCQLRVAV